jgi:hypothetical protein
VTQVCHVIQSFQNLPHLIQKLNPTVKFDITPSPIPEPAGHNILHTFPEMIRREPPSFGPANPAMRTFHAEGMKREKHHPEGKTPHNCFKQNMGLFTAGLWTDSPMSLLFHTVSCKNETVTDLPDSVRRI